MTEMCISNALCILMISDQSVQYNQT